MGLKDADAAMAADWATKGWLAYIQQVTKHEDAAMPVDQRMLFALAGEELPDWLWENIRIRLVAARSRVLAAREAARAEHRLDQPTSG